MTLAALLIFVVLAVIVGLGAAVKISLWFMLLVALGLIAALIAGWLMLSD
jgi:hypothetical protein